MATTSNLFARAQNKDAVFKDKTVLSPHHIPDKLYHRDGEIKRIVNIISPTVRNEKPTNVFVYGKTGVGKTCVVKYILGDLSTYLKGMETAGLLRVVYVNNKIYNTKYRTLVKALRTIFEETPEMGLSPALVYEKLIDYIQKNKAGLLVVLDEIDAVKDLDDLLYILTRINDELDEGFLTIIGISNNLSFKKSLDPRSKSTLCEEEVVFPPYNAEQITKILTGRIKGGFHKNIVSSSGLKLIAAIAAQEGGDARYALRLLQRSGEVVLEKDGKVDEVCVKEAKRRVEEDIIYESITTLPTHQQILLYSLADLTINQPTTTLHGAQRRQFISGELYEKYKKDCKEFLEKPRSMRWIREYLSDLEMLGFITVRMSGKGVRGQTRVIEMGEDPEKIVTTIRKTLL